MITESSRLDNRIANALSLETNLIPDYRPDYSNNLDDQFDDLKLRILSWSDGNKFNNAEHTSRILFESGLLTRKSVLWILACGSTAKELAAFSSSCPGYIYGIDPKLNREKDTGYVRLVKSSIKQALENPKIKRPDVVISRRYLGIHRDVEQILHLETQPVMLLSLCACSSCYSSYLTPIDKVKAQKSLQLASRGKSISSFVRRNRLPHRWRDPSLYCGYTNPTQALAQDIMQLADEKGYQSKILPIADSKATRVISFPESKRKSIDNSYDKLNRFFF